MSQLVREAEEAPVEPASRSLPAPLPSGVYRPSWGWKAIFAATAALLLISGLYLQTTWLQAPPVEANLPQTRLAESVEQILPGRTDLESEPQSDRILVEGFDDGSLESWSIHHGPGT